MAFARLDLPIGVAVKICYGTPGRHAVDRIRSGGSHGGHAAILVVLGRWLPARLAEHTDVKHHNPDRNDKEFPPSRRRLTHTCLL
jgi:hypothetical protein